MDGGFKLIIMDGQDVFGHTSNFLYMYIKLVSGVLKSKLSLRQNTSNFFRPLDSNPSTENSLFITLSSSCMC